MDDAVEEIARQYEQKDLSPSEYRAATRGQNPLGNFDDPDLAFGADEVAAANRDPNMVYRYDPDADEAWNRYIDEVAEQEEAGIGGLEFDEPAGFGAVDEGIDELGLPTEPIARAQVELEIAEFELETLRQSPGAGPAPKFGSRERAEWDAARMQRAQEGQPVQNKAAAIREAKVKIDRAKRRLDQAMRDAGPDVPPEMAPGAVVQPEMFGAPQQVGMDIGGQPGRMPEQLMPEEGVVAQGVRAAEVRAGQMGLPEEAIPPAAVTPELPPAAAPPPAAAAPSPAAALDELPGFTQDNPLVKAQQTGNPDAIQRAEGWIADNPTTKTGGFRNIELPPDDVGRLPGRTGEETRIDQPRSIARIEELADDMRQRGWIGEPIAVDVDVDDAIKIFEGNHRVRAAQLAGLDRIPVEVRYYGGSEMSPGPWSPNDLVQKSAPSPAAVAPSPAAAPTPVAAAVDDSQRQAIASKWAGAKSRNSANASTDLNKLKESGFDVGDAEDALTEYKATVRADFDDAESFSEARTEAWDNFVVALDEVESVDTGLPTAVPEPAAAQKIRIKILEDQPRVRIVEEKPLSGPLPENGPPVAPTTGTHRAYHGTAQVFDAFNEGAQSSNALYGPGVYLTEDASVASRYAITTGTRKPLTDYTGRPIDAFGKVLSDEELEVLRTGGAPNVWSMDIRVNKFLDIDAVPEQELLDVLNRPDMVNVLNDGLDAAGFNSLDELATNDDLYTLLRGAFEDKSEVNDWLIANGYDTITHIGGARTGTKPHRVWISIDGETVSPAFGKNKPSAAAMIDAPPPAAVAGPPPAGTVPIPEEAIPTPRPAGAVPEGVVAREAVDVPEQAVTGPPDRPVGVVPEEVAPVRSEAAVKATDDFDAAAAKARDGVPSNLKNERVAKKADDLVRVLDDEAANVAGLDDLRAAVDDYQSHRASVKGNPKGGRNKSTHPETVRRVQAVERAVANLGDEAAAPIARAAVPQPSPAVIETPPMPSPDVPREYTGSLVPDSETTVTIGGPVTDAEIAAAQRAGGAPVGVNELLDEMDAASREVAATPHVSGAGPTSSARRAADEGIPQEPKPDIGGAGRGADGDGPPPRDVDGEELFDEAGDPVPESLAPKLHQALKNIATQMRMDAPGAFGQFLSLLPGISQIQHWLRPANKIAAHIMKAYIGQGAVRARLMTQMFAEREVVLYPLLREHFGADALTGAKLPSEIVQYIGSQEEFVEEIANTLLDVAQRPHLYSLNGAQQQALRRWQQYQMKFMNEIIDGYGVKVDIFEVADGSVFLSNVNVDDALLEALDINVAQAVGRGRNKHRFYDTAADRYLTIRRNVDEVVEERQRSLETALDRPLTTNEIEDLRLSLIHI